MYLLQKPYKPVMYTGLSAQFNVIGKSFKGLQAVYLSGTPLNNTTFYNPFSGVPKLSAQYPGFNALKLPTTAYFTNNDNLITIIIPAPARTGLIDVIVQNPAGYGALTQYVIKDLYTGTQTQQRLRPWHAGVHVLSGEETTPTIENQMLTITGDDLITISGDNIVSI